MNINILVSRCHPFLVLYFGVNLGVGVDGRECSSRASARAVAGVGRRSLFLLSRFLALATRRRPELGCAHNRATGLRYHPDLFNPSFNPSSIHPPILPLVFHSSIHPSSHARKFAPNKEFNFGEVNIYLQQGSTTCCLVFHVTCVGRFFKLPRNPELDMQYLGSLIYVMSEASSHICGNQNAITNSKSVKNMILAKIEFQAKSFREYLSQYHRSGLQLEIWLY